MIPTKKEINRIDLNKEELVDLVFILFQKLDNYKINLKIGS